jgi:hypothetical protein
MCNRAVVVAVTFIAITEVYDKKGYVEWFWVEWPVKIVGFVTHSYPIISSSYIAGYPSQMPSELLFIPVKSAQVTD